ncbi:hypothetical protein FKG94_21270 [Exilibacterium tricleocarpae]|uniref:Glycosyl hydrolase n=1 Tax=Exilibacterium tricleocarpae TaxID=2591008 RepID=A0A545T011_9GAMM|nr:glycoside hydrolase family 88 protein [Exilibacterium tricleocarpae]TQV70555.1 hypothetical protein FKG94_21270 [Exilibacterium tricleocarpae]
MQWPFRLWSFGEAIAMDGLLQAASTVGRSTYQAYVHALLLATVARNIGRNDNDHLVPARALLCLYHRLGDQRFLDAAGKVVAFHEHLPTTKYGALLVRAQQPGWAHQIWVDSMDIVGPLYVAYAKATGEDQWHERAVMLTLAYARHLQTESGLFLHGFDNHAGPNGGLWARGQGWALAGMGDVLENSPASTRGYSELHERYLRLVEAVVTRQQPSGLWNTVIGDTDTYEETTLAAMFVTEMTSRRVGGAPVRTATENARLAVRSHVTSDGHLELVSSATPIGQHSTYATRPFGFYPWGQGALLNMECRSSDNEG